MSGISGAGTDEVEIILDDILTETQSLVGQSISTNLDGGGKNQVGVIAVELTFTGTTESIIISADTSNTGTLFVGKSDVQGSGANAIAFLEAGESLIIDYDDSTNALYVIANLDSQFFFKGATL